MPLLLFYHIPCLISTRCGYPVKDSFRRFYVFCFESLCGYFSHVRHSCVWLTHPQALRSDVTSDHPASRLRNGSEYPYYKLRRGVEIFLFSGILGDIEAAIYAWVAELVYAQHSKCCGRKLLGVRVSPQAPSYESQCLARGWATKSYGVFVAKGNPRFR